MGGSDSRPRSALSASTARPASGAPCRPRPDTVDDAASSVVGMDSAHGPRCGMNWIAVERLRRGASMPWSVHAVERPCCGASMPWSVHAVERPWSAHGAPMDQDSTPSTITRDCGSSTGGVGRTPKSAARKPPPPAAAPAARRRQPTAPALAKAARAGSGRPLSETRSVAVRAAAPAAAAPAGALVVGTVVLRVLRRPLPPCVRGDRESERARKRESERENERERLMLCLR
jgi:hypothetical protein